MPPMLKLCLLVCGMEAVVCKNGSCGTHPDAFAATLAIIRVDIGQIVAYRYGAECTFLKALAAANARSGTDFARDGATVAAGACHPHHAAVGFGTQFQKVARAFCRAFAAACAYAVIDYRQPVFSDGYGAERAHTHTVAAPEAAIAASAGSHTCGVENRAVAGAFVVVELRAVVAVAVAAQHGYRAAFRR